MIKYVHVGSTGGHFGIKRTLDQVKRRFYWPSWKADTIGGAENAGVENAGAKTYGDPSIQKSLTVEAPIRMCLIVNGRKSPISGKPNRTDWPGSWNRSHTL